MSSTDQVHSLVMELKSAGSTNGIDLTSADRCLCLACLGPIFCATVCAILRPAPDVQMKMQTHRRICPNRGVRCAHESVGCLKVCGWRGTMPSADDNWRKCVGVSSTGES